MKIVSKLLVVLAVVACAVAAGCENVIEVAVPEEDATEVLRAAIDEAAAFDGRPVTIRLETGDYHISPPFRSIVANCIAASVMYGASAISRISL